MREVCQARVGREGKGRGQDWQRGPALVQPGSASSQSHENDLAVGATVVRAWASTPACLGENQICLLPAVPPWGNHFSLSAYTSSVHKTVISTMLTSQGAGSIKSEMLGMCA